MIEIAPLVIGYVVADAVIEVILNPEICLETKRNPFATGKKKSKSISCEPDAEKRTTLDSNITPELFCNSTNICPAADAVIKTDFSLVGVVQLKTKYLLAIIVFEVTVPDTVVGPTFAKATSLSTQYEVVVFKAGVV